jgi:hypothetical protein
MDKTKQIINSLKSRPQVLTPIATDMFIPNHSGDMSAGKVLTTPTQDNDVVNKKYVDDENAKDLHLNQSAPQKIYNAAEANYISFQTDGNIGFGIATPTGLTTKKIHIHNPNANFVGVRLTHSTSGSLSTDGFDWSLNSGTAYIINRETGGLDWYTGGVRMLLMTSGTTPYNTFYEHVVIYSDTKKLFFGAARDASIYYDGTNFIINPKDVGSGILDVQGVVQTDGYKSSDGSAGVSGSFTTTDGKTITIKDGLVTSIV